MNKHELSNPASREGYADLTEFTPDGQREYPVDRPGTPLSSRLDGRYKSPGPGPSAGIPKADLELSKIDKQIEEIRGILKRGHIASGSEKAAAIKYALLKIELSTNYLKEHA